MSAPSNESESKEPHYGEEGKLEETRKVAAILNPQEDDTLRAGDALRLWGVATYSYGKPIDRASSRWLIDGKEVAQGFDEFVTAPSQGQHRCTLIAEADGKTVEQTIKFKTISEESQGEEKRNKRK